MAFGGTSFLLAVDMEGGFSLKKKGRAVGFKCSPARLGREESCTFFFYLKSGWVESTFWRII